MAYPVIWTDRMPEGRGGYEYGPLIIALLLSVFSHSLAAQTVDPAKDKELSLYIESLQSQRNEQANLVAVLNAKLLISIKQIEDLKKQCPAPVPAPERK